MTENKKAKMIEPGTKKAKAEKPKYERRLMNTIGHANAYAFENGLACITPAMMNDRTKMNEALGKIVEHAKLHQSKPYAKNVVRAYDRFVNGPIGSSDPREQDRRERVKKAKETFRAAVKAARDAKKKILDEVKRDRAADRAKKANAPKLVKNGDAKS